jgi:hypothetical protein
MFVGIGTERIEVSIADPEQQESVLRFIQAEPGKALAFSERPKVEVEIRAELPFRVWPRGFGARLPYRGRFRAAAELLSGRTLPSP